MTKIRVQNIEPAGIGRLKSRPGNWKFSVFRDNMSLLVLALPAIIYFIVFCYLPMIGVVLAFKDYNYAGGILGSPWNGLKNFEFFFKSQDAWRITRNTLLYSGTFILLSAVASVTIALLLYEIRSKLALKFFQTSMILPRFLSWVIVSYMVYTLLNPSLGIANQILKSFGLEAANWYSDPKYWPFILTIVHIWKVVGLDCIFYYSALLGIDQELFEAAKIDGANRWQQTLYISIPSLFSLMTILIILALGGIFRGDFGLFYQLPRDIGVLYPTTDIVDTYVFRGLRQGTVGVTTAIGLFQSVVGFVMVMGTNFAVKKIKPENALF